ncbi:hypothetical protein [Streptomyces sp. S1]|uniref:hypothetical protein n=1 Tax=Streptomyces sp. S1 TaxID=718288 RepID=UPI003D756B52
MSAHDIVSGQVTNRRDHVPARRIAKRVLIIVSAIFATMLALGLTINGLNGDLTTKKDGFPACEWEDGSGSSEGTCYWDADTQGNGRGHDVIHHDGRTFVEVK